MKTNNYLNSVHRVGRFGSLMAVAFMIGVPLIMCAVYNCIPDLAAVIAAAIPLLAFMLPADFSEIIGFAPILGSASYITFITGNVQNLKLPVVISAQQKAGVDANTEESDAISSLAVSLSSMVTILILFFGMLLIQPLEPILSAPAIQTATGYMIPALFGSLTLGLFTRSEGRPHMKNKALLFVIIVIAVVAVVTLFPVLLDYQGFVLIGAIIAIIAIAYPLYKKGVVRFDTPTKGE